MPPEGPVPNRTPGVNTLQEDYLFTNLIEFEKIIKKRWCYLISPYLIMQLYP
jgi:hypothetical protein